MKRILLGIIFIILLTSLSWAFVRIVFLNAVTVTGASAWESISDRARRTYYVTISGTATVEIQMAENTARPIIIRSLTVTGSFDTDAPGVFTRVNVASCTGCTVTVVMTMD